MEKRKTLYRLMALLLLPLLYYAVFTGFSITEPNKITNNPPAPNTRDFVNFILNNDYTVINDPNIWVESQLPNYRGELNFNGIHIYDVIGGNNGTEYGTNRFGYFNQNLSTGQIAEIQNLTGDISGENLKLYWERVKISRLCYAQRLVYEVSQNNSTTNYGFCYQNCNGQYMTDSGRTVIYTGLPGNNSQGYIAQNIYENMQHGDLADWSPQYADAGTWHMKPMMRIDSTVVDSNPDANVVKIDVVNFRGQPVKSVTIKARNFAHFDIGNGYLYDGRYIDVYDFALDPGTDLTVSGDTTYNSAGLNDGMLRYPWDQWEANCRVDFKIWWYGTVNVWFDKMTVDDRDANILFAPSPANFDAIITNEINNTAGLGFTYFADEMLPSQVPCIRYVDSLMKSINPNVKLNCAITNYLNVRSMRDDEHCYRMFLENLDLYSFSNDAHEFHQSIIPDVFPPGELDGRVPNWWLKTPAEYNACLQYRSLGDKNSRTEMKAAKAFISAFISIYTTSLFAIKYV
jgi:hypothetical protein